MHSTRTHHTTAEAHNHAHSHPIAVSTISPPTGPPSAQTPLPSIRQLHPYLPPAGMSQALPMPPTVSVVDAVTPGSTSYSTLSPRHYSQGQLHTVHHLGAQREAIPLYAVPESEADELDHQGPPKKKRRRQALSCTGN
ncbi:hypothetical protein AMATHDRAFT_1324 [Amanita thiersii Skay4041]|uniref:Uncharacterized protein n=1 Tax=Amanita thiersii Skay4041 TaxID=703135 RepID=A0A2A9NXR6_9AGAR|nr:hypothetical protein AMATHDRAFT_1324 [Amanita thiersii Skay4041]